MSKVLLVISVTLFFFSTVLSQTSKSKTILEVRKIAGGMVADSGNYLFLRVLENGEVEYEKAEIKDGKQNFVLHKHQIKKEKLKAFVKILGDDKLQTAREVYKPDVPIIDHVIKLNISIILNSKNKKIRLVNYDPSLSDIDKKYPAKLIELVCHIKSLRYKSDFTMIGDKCITIKKIESKSKE